MSSEAILTKWPFLGLALAATMIVALFALPRQSTTGPRFQDIAWLLWLALPIYMLHQFEEHGYDLSGTPYPFQAVMCRRLGFDDVAACPATPTYLFIVNVLNVWLGSLIAIVAGKKRIMVGACTIAIVLVNGVAHIMSTIVFGIYNPGLLTSVLLFVPFSAWFFWRLLKDGRLSKRQIVVAVFSGAALHAGLMAGLQAKIHGVFSDAALYAYQGLMTFVPLAIGFRSGGDRTTPEVSD